MDSGKDNLISLAIYHDARAFKLKDILEFHDIPVVLDDVTGHDSHVIADVKSVKIPLSLLESGLKILESGDTALSPSEMFKMTGLGRSLLIPVDFSPSSMTAVEVGFNLALKFGIEPVILHAFIAPVFNPADSYGGIEPDADPEVDAIETIDLRRIAASKLSNFKKKVSEAQNNGDIPDVKFSTTLLEGVPEQVIIDYCRLNSPMLVVMSTRGVDKKESDLIGSVTAEVIDSCRVPVFTLPEGFQSQGVEKIRNIALFCNFSDIDLTVVRTLMKMFDFPSVDFVLMPVSDRPFAGVSRKLEDLRDFLAATYPTASFHVPHEIGGDFEETINNVFSRHDTKLIIVPNKKSTALSRFFKPTLAHKILYDKDLPMLVIPV